MTLIPVFLLDGLAVILAFLILREDSRVKWLARGHFLIPLFLGILFIDVLCIHAWAGATENATGKVFAIIAVTLLVPPVGALMVAFGATGLTRLLTGSGKELTQPLTCDRAEQAWRAGHIEDARGLFEAAAVQPHKGGPQDATGLYLLYANFLREQGPPEQAIAYFKKALAGSLPSDQYCVTALRTAELLAGPLNNKRAAKAILKTALTRHPKATEAPALKARLARL